MSDDEAIIWQGPPRARSLGGRSRLTTSAGGRANADRSAGMSLADYVTQDMMFFGLACVVTAALFIYLDWVLLDTKGRSFLEIDSGKSSRWLALAQWATAAGIVGLLSAALQILQPNLQAAVTVAIGWPMILAKIVEGGTGTVQAPTTEKVVAK